MPDDDDADALLRWGKGILLDCRSGDAGSSPARSAKMGGVAQFGRATALQAVGCGFDAHRFHRKRRVLPCSV